MFLNDRYYIDFLLSKKVSKINVDNVATALSQGDQLELSYVQLLEAMLVTKEYPAIRIEYLMSGKPVTEIFTFNREDVVFLLNSLVCTTEFLPTVIDRYDEFRKQKSDYARKALMVEFQKYLIAGSHPENVDSLQIS